MRQHVARLLSNAAASTSVSSGHLGFLLIGAGRQLNVNRSESIRGATTQLVCRGLALGRKLHTSHALSGTGPVVALPQQAGRLSIHVQSSGAAKRECIGVLLAVRRFSTSRESNMAFPLLVPAAVFSIAKIWFLKPAGAVLKSMTVGNLIRAARAGSMIRKSWEYKLARRILISSAVAATLLGVATLVACDFDDAQAAAVLRSIPRTLGAAAWCAHAGWTYKTSLMGYTDTESAEYLAALQVAHQECAERLVNLCSSNGGIYVKAAQFLASLQTVPVEYRKTLERLQDQAEPQPFEDTRRAVERELGAPLEEIFAEFEQDARAAASLAQNVVPLLWNYLIFINLCEVHKAKLHNGREVAVKVQYLGLESAVSADLSTLSVLGAIAALVFPNSFEFGWVVERLGKNLDKELDFDIEAQNAARFGLCMAGNRNVAVPQPVPELSGRRILTMEWVEGVKLNDRKGMVALHIRPRDTALQLLKAFAQMIFIHGYVHADPHGGNILVRPHPGPKTWSWRFFGFGWRQPQIVVLDHGLYVDLPHELRQNYCALWCSFLVNDLPTATLVGQRIAGERGGKLLPVLLKPGELRSQEQRAEFRKEAGIDGLGDIGRLIEGLPEEFLQLLRISAVIRPTANAIGATNADRMRINATYAYKGMWKSNDGIPATLNTVSRRIWMSVALRGMRVLFWTGCMLHDTFDAVTFFPMKVAHKMFEARYV